MKKKQLALSPMPPIVKLTVPLSFPSTSFVSCPSLLMFFKVPSRVIVKVLVRITDTVLGCTGCVADDHKKCKSHKRYNGKGFHPTLQLRSQANVATCWGVFVKVNMRMVCAPCSQGACVFKAGHTVEANMQLSCDAFGRC